MGCLNKRKKMWMSALEDQYLCLSLDVPSCSFHTILVFSMLFSNVYIHLVLREKEPYITIINHNGTFLPISHSSTIQVTGPLHLLPASAFWHWLSVEPRIYLIDIPNFHNLLVKYTHYISLPPRSYYITRRPSKPSNNGLAISLK